MRAKPSPTDYPLAAAAVVVVVAAVATAAEGAAVAAVTEQKDQNDDPPPVVVQAAADTVIVVAHKITSRDSFSRAVRRSFHVIPGCSFCAAGRGETLSAFFCVMGQLPTGACHQGR